MKYLMVDISGKVPKYDIALCEALSPCLGDKSELTLLAANISSRDIKCNAKRLLSLIPKKFQNSENKYKRSIKAFEGLLNYLYLVFYVFWKRPSIVHFQWMPFLEVASVERIFLRLVKIASPKSRIWLTIHNIYPHNSNDKSRIRYKSRFVQIDKFFDLFVLHLQTSKIEFCKEFGIDECRCKVIPHGIFEPKNLKITPHERGEKLRLVMYGNQSYYKGTDILVDAIALLPKKIQEKVSTTIVGKISDDYLTILQKKAKGLDISIIPEYVSDDELNKIILDSDVIVLPYREISQSGVLLLALYFERPIICSDLSSFRETLHLIPKDYFFESGNPNSLMTLIEKYIEENVDVKHYLEKMLLLKEEYSWKEMALMYLKLYEMV